MGVHCPGLALQPGRLSKTAGPVASPPSSWWARAVYNNLLCLGITEDVDALLTERAPPSPPWRRWRTRPWATAAWAAWHCFLDSAATLDLPLDWVRHPLPVRPFQAGH